MLMKQVEGGSLAQASKTQQSSENGSERATALRWKDVKVLSQPPSSCRRRPGPGGFSVADLSLSLSLPPLWSASSLRPPPGSLRIIGTVIHVSFVLSPTETSAHFMSRGSKSDSGT